MSRRFCVFPSDDTFTASVHRMYCAGCTINVLDFPSRYHVIVRTYQYSRSSSSVTQFYCRLFPTIISLLYSKSVALTTALSEHSMSLVFNGVAQIM